MSLTLLSRGGIKRLPVPFCWHSGTITDSCDESRSPEEKTLGRKQLRKAIVKIGGR